MCFFWCTVIILQYYLQRLGVKMSQLKHQEQADYQNRKAVNNNNINKNYNHNNHNMGNQNVKKTSQKGGGNINGGSPNGTGPMATIVKKSSAKNKEKEREEREKIVLWRRPFQTVKYSTLECTTLIQIYGKKLLEHRLVLLGVLVLIALLGILYNVPGRHQLVIESIRSQSWFILYWVGLGVLSSVGLGTGLHTFLLYLGPHIASVTLAAYECNALNFPKPPYPDEIICPDVPDQSITPNLWNIMAKVRFEAFLWGAGTALGELPPYFMAKAARLSGIDPDDDDDLKKFEELQKKQKSGDLSALDKAKLFMEKVVEKVGFLGILACASIPNPLFDLAGITCGHFLVPFWTFFGATLLGKAVIKMHIQKIFVIIAFNESLIERAVDLIALVPIFGRRLQEPFKAFLENQKTRLHRQKSHPTSESGNLLAKIFEKFVIAMICYFVISIINSLAQSYHKRIHKKGGKIYRKIAKD
ncbi:vacuole membrane protein 1 isoform X3 [Condylostylus longicornis]|uniref:vacuole membrane protein 1 isoform X3 n=1 Tax=Condylostylus longicornis TaxID=2530218 RepID=UPI00244DE010|nr:vacuole membrane protein 1 isoform X3 [Condylostylus longicornis]